MGSIVFTPSPIAAQQSSNTPRETPLRLLIKLFPDLARLVFDRCITNNLQTDTKQGNIVSDDDVQETNSTKRIGAILF